MLLTNGEYVDPEGTELRKFKLIAKHESYSWVQALNGHYKWELLTFKTETLMETTYDA